MNDVRRPGESLQRVEDGEQRQHYYEMIVGETQRLRRLVEVAQSEVETGQVQPHRGTRLRVAHDELPQALRLRRRGLDQGPQVLDFSRREIGQGEPGRRRLADKPLARLHGRRFQACAGYLDFSRQHLARGALAIVLAATAFAVTTTLCSTR